MLPENMVFLKKDLNTWFRKGDVIEIIKRDEKSKLVYVYCKKYKKYMWLMEKDLM